MADKAPRDIEEFGDLLRRLRERAGLTQEELAERSGLSARGISDLERGARRHPRKDTVRLLVTALHLAPADRAALFAAIPPLISSTAQLRRQGSAVAVPTPLTPLTGGEPFPAAHLPVPPDAFVGRRHEVAAILKLLSDPTVRLVTLVGPGGVGKTRLAVKAAGNLRAAFAEGVLFVSLAAVVDPNLVPATIARSLGIQESGSRSLEERLMAALRGRRVLLLLDNFEHLLAAASLVAGLVASCPNLKLLVTSRTPLHVTGEHRFPVPPLSLPSREVEETRSRAEPDSLLASSSARLLDSDAVALFAQRARQVRPDFVVSEAHADAVLEICRRLDGLPLAIELAAARIALLSPAALLRRLDQRLPILVGGPRDQPARQRSMREAIAWSHDLLSPAEQTVFRRLAVFVGGCTLDAAAAVADPDDSLDVFEIVASLVDGSLLRSVEVPGGESRFDMLEMVREFGIEQLASADDGESTGRRHATLFCALAEEAESSLLGKWDGRWMARLEADLDNLRAALTWAVGHGAVETACRLVWGLMPFWFFSGRFVEGREWAERALALPDDAPVEVRIKALQVASGFARILRDYERNRTRGEEGLAMARASGNQALAGRMLLQMADAAVDQGYPELARERYEEALVALEGEGDSFWREFAREGIGLLACERGDFASAEAQVGATLTFFRALGNPFLIAGTLRALGEIAHRQGGLARAAEAWKESLAIQWREGLHWNALWRIEDLGLIAVRDEPERATRLLGAATALLSNSQTRLDPVVQQQHDAALAAARDALGEDAFAAAWAAGRGLPLAEAVAEAMLVTVKPEPEPASIAAISPPTHGLTPRELEILRLVNEGHSNKEIAGTLFVSPRTVDNHVTNILAKLDVPSRTAAVAAARRLGLC